MKRIIEFLKKTADAVVRAYSWITGFGADKYMHVIAGMAVTAQGISLTNGCCIPVTYKGVYAGNISLINGDWYGLLVKNTNNPADNINIKLSADGTITEGNSAQ